MDFQPCHLQPCHFFSLQDISSGVVCHGGRIFVLECEGAFEDFGDAQKTVLLLEFLPRPGVPEVRIAIRDRRAGGGRRRGRAARGQGGGRGGGGWRRRGAAGDAL